MMKVLILFAVLVLAFTAPNDMGETDTNGAEKEVASSTASLEQGRITTSNFHFSYYS